MKKYVLVLTVLVLTLFGAACGNDAEKTSGEGGSFSETTEQKKEEVKDSEKVEETADSTSGLRPEFKEAMDSYEAFYDEYCTFMQKYMNNPSDLTMLTKYTDLMSKATDVDEKFDAWDQSDMSDEELKYYLDVSNRVMKKLVDVSGQ